MTSKTIPVPTEHGTPSPRDLRVLHRLRHLPTLGQYARKASHPQTPAVSAHTLIVPDSLSHPHFVRIRLPNLPGRPPTPGHTALTIKLKDRSQAQHLLTILHSNTALYWAFMTTRSAPDDAVDWLGLPIPPEPQSSRNNGPSRRDQEIRVLDAYAFSAQDRATIADALDYVIVPALTGRQKGNKKQAAPQQIEAYAHRIATQLNPFLRPADLQLKATIHLATADSTIQACRLDAVTSKQDNDTQFATCSGLQDLLARLSTELTGPTAQHLARSSYARVYDGFTTWIIKPPQEKYWTQAAALNDADIIFQDHMEGDSSSGDAP